MASIVAAAEHLLALLTVPLSPSACVTAAATAVRKWAAALDPSSDAGHVASSLLEAVDALRGPGSTVPEVYRCMATMHSRWMHAADPSGAPVACQTFHLQLAQGTGDTRVLEAVVKLQESARMFGVTCRESAAAGDVSVRDMKVHLSRLCGVGVDGVNTRDQCMRTAPTITVRPSRCRPSRCAAVATLGHHELSSRADADMT